MQHRWIRRALAQTVRLRRVVWSSRSSGLLCLCRLQSTAHGSSETEKLQLGGSLDNVSAQSAGDNDQDGYQTVQLADRTTIDEDGEALRCTATNGTVLFGKYFRQLAQLSTHRHLLPTASDDGRPSGEWVREMDRCCSGVTRCLFNDGNGGMHHPVDKDSRAHRSSTSPRVLVFKTAWKHAPIARVPLAALPGWFQTPIGVPRTVTDAPSPAEAADVSVVVPGELLAAVASLLEGAPALLSFTVIEQCMHAVDAFEASCAASARQEGTRHRHVSHHSSILEFSELPDASHVEGVRTVIVSAAAVTRAILFRILVVQQFHQVLSAPASTHMHASSSSMLDGLHSLRRVLGWETQAHNMSIDGKECRPPPLLPSSANTSKKTPLLDVLSIPTCVLVSYLAIGRCSFRFLIQQVAGRQLHACGFASSASSRRGLTIAMGFHARRLCKHVSLGAHSGGMDPSMALRLLLQFVAMVLPASPTSVSAARENLGGAPPSVDGDSAALLWWTCVDLIGPIMERFRRELPPMLARRVVYEAVVPVIHAVVGNVASVDEAANVRTPLWDAALQSDWGKLLHAMMPAGDAVAPQHMLAECTTKRELVIKFFQHALASLTKDLCSPNRTIHDVPLTASALVRRGTAYFALRAVAAASCSFTATAEVLASQKTEATYVLSQMHKALITEGALVTEFRYGCSPGDAWKGTGSIFYPSASSNEPWNAPGLPWLGQPAAAICGALPMFAVAVATDMSMRLSMLRLLHTRKTLDHSQASASETLRQALRAFRNASAFIHAPLVDRRGSCQEEAAARNRPTCLLDEGLADASIPPLPVVLAALRVLMSHFSSTSHFDSGHRHPCDNAASTLVDDAAEYLHWCCLRIGAISPDAIWTEHEEVPIVSSAQGATAGDSGGDVANNTQKLCLWISPSTAIWGDASCKDDAEFVQYWLRSIVVLTGSGLFKDLATVTILRLIRLKFLSVAQGMPILANRFGIEKSTTNMDDIIRVGDVFHDLTKSLLAGRCSPEEVPPTDDRRVRSAPARQQDRVTSMMQSDGLVDLVTTVQLLSASAVAVTQVPEDRELTPSDEVASFVDSVLRGLILLDWGRGASIGSYRPSPRRSRRLRRIEFQRLLALGIRHSHSVDGGPGRTPLSLHGLTPERFVSCSLRTALVATSSSAFGGTTGGVSKAQSLVPLTVLSNLVAIWLDVFPLGMRAHVGQCTTCSSPEDAELPELLLQLIRRVVSSVEESLHSLAREPHHRRIATATLAARISSIAPVCTLAMLLRLLSCFKHLIASDGAHQAQEMFHIRFGDALLRLTHQWTRLSPHNSAAATKDHSNRLEHQTTVLEQYEHVVRGASLLIDCAIRRPNVSDVVAVQHALLDTLLHVVRETANLLCSREGGVATQSIRLTIRWMRVAGYALTRAADLEGCLRAFLSGDSGQLGVPPVLDRIALSAKDNATQRSMHSTEHGAKPSSLSGGAVRTAVHRITTHLVLSVFPRVSSCSTTLQHERQPTTLCTHREAVLMSHYTVDELLSLFVPLLKGAVACNVVFSAAEAIAAASMLSELLLVERHRWVSYRRTSCSGERRAQPAAHKELHRLELLCCCLMQLRALRLASAPSTLSSVEDGGDLVALVHAQVRVHVLGLLEDNWDLFVEKTSLSSATRGEFPPLQWWWEAGLPSVMAVALK